ncbi:MAG: response regulator, partial [Thermoleophilia bacterium]|nr:response regulator [Thermoleophilia bacterium]
MSVTAEDVRRQVASSVVDFGPERIMVVDDEPGVQRLLSRAIEAAGYSVQAFGSAEEAAAVLTPGEFAVALVDIRMPGQGGIWLLEQLRSVSPDTAAIMVTAEDDSRTAVECLNRGAADYLIKPVDLTELLEVVRKAVAGRRLAIENRTSMETLEGYLDTLYRVEMAVELRVGRSGFHGLRVGVLSCLLAGELGLPDDFRETLLYASPLHDLGKVGPIEHMVLGDWLLTPVGTAVMQTARIIA